MTAARKLNLISIEDYLSGELESPIKYEYLGGFVYAMAGARNVHNMIAANILTYSHRRLHGQRCRPWNSDTKVRIQLPGQTRFYYPDDSIVCDSNPASDSFQDRPVVIFEVVSKTTRRTDEGEKKDAYLTIPSLQVYALVEQESATIAVYRRSATGFVRGVFEVLGAVLPLEVIGIELPLAEIYEGVEFTPEPGGDDL